MVVNHTWRETSPFHPELDTQLPILEKQRLLLLAFINRGKPKNEEWLILIQIPQMKNASLCFG